MKKVIILTTVFLLALSLSASAQEAYQKGSWIIDGQVFYQKYTGDAYREANQGQILWEFGPAISNGLFIGFSGSIIYDETTYYDDETNWLIGPFLKYYFNHNSDSDSQSKVSPYFQIRPAYGGFGEIDIMTVEAYFGINILLNRSIGLDIAMMGTYDRVSYSGSWYYSSTTRTGHRINVGVGFSKFLF